MSEIKPEKEILFEIGNVRIVKNDDRNVMVERLEEVVNSKTNEVSGSWRFKGYSETILGGLRIIINKELLIDRNSLNGLESYVYKVEDSNKTVLEALKNERKDENANQV